MKFHFIYPVVLVMRLTVLLFTAGFSLASCSGYSQTTVLKRPDATLEKVFHEIKEQSGCNFLNERKLMQKVLCICFIDQSMGYSIIEKLVVIKVKGKVIYEGHLILVLVLTADEPDKPEVQEYGITKEGLNTGMPSPVSEVKEERPSDEMILIVVILEMMIFLEIFKKVKNKEMRLYLIAMRIIATYFQVSFLYNHTLQDAQPILAELILCALVKIIEDNAGNNDV